MTEPAYNTQLAQFLPSTNGNGPLTMSSVEIAELTGKKHAHVMRDVRVMLEGLDGGQSKFGSTYTDAQGKPRDCYSLPKRECLILVSGYSVELRAKIVDRWMELEGQLKSEPTAIDFSDPAILLGVVGHLQGKISEQALVIAEQGVKVKALDRLQSSEGSMCITDAAKTLGMRPKDLFARMQAERWIYKRPGNTTWLAYQDKLQSFLMEHDDHPFIDGLGRERVATRALVTAKGLVKLAELLSRPLH